MNTKDGQVRFLRQDEMLKSTEVRINTPQASCSRCKGKGSVPREQTIRAERRRAERKGVPQMSNFYPCPECGGY